MVDEEEAYQFLIGLNDEVYSNIRGQILVIEHLSLLDKIFNMVHQEDKHLMMDRDDRMRIATTFAVIGKIMLTVNHKGAWKHCRRFSHEET